jgi:hypothetical protein
MKNPNRPDYQGNLVGHLVSLFDGITDAQFFTGVVFLGGVMAGLITALLVWIVK